jgi:hypothetical protein
MYRSMDDARAVNAKQRAAAADGGDFGRRGEYKNLAEGAGAEEIMVPDNVDVMTLCDSNLARVVTGTAGGGDIVDAASERYPIYCTPAALDETCDADTHHLKDFTHVTAGNEFKWDSVAPFVSSSRDRRLVTLAAEHGCRVAGSTSSCSGIISQIYREFSGGRSCAVSSLSEPFSVMQPRFTMGATTPPLLHLKRRLVPAADNDNDNDAAAAAAAGKAGGTQQPPVRAVWCLDGSQSAEAFAGNKVLIEGGRIIECQLTTEPDEFVRRHVKTDVNNDGETTAETAAEDEAAEQQPCVYVKTNSNMMLRSQLDCRGVDADGVVHVFDVKARAVHPIRLDCPNHRLYADYNLTAAGGKFNSFEREWYDMARAAFMKYIIQVRIGKMSGVMVAYNNATKLFGYQFLPVAHMDRVAFGSAAFGEHVFQTCTRITTAAIDAVVASLDEVAYAPADEQLPATSRDLPGDIDDSEVGRHRGAARLLVSAHNQRVYFFAEVLPPSYRVNKVAAKGKKSKASQSFEAVEVMSGNRQLGVVMVDGLTTPDIRRQLTAANISFDADETRQTLVRKLENHVLSYDYQFTNAPQPRKMHSGKDAPELEMHHPTPSNLTREGDAAKYMKMLRAGKLQIFELQVKNKWTGSKSLNARVDKNDVKLVQMTTDDIAAVDDWSPLSTSFTLKRLGVDSARTDAHDALAAAAGGPVYKSSEAFKPAKLETLRELAELYSDQLHKKHDPKYVAKPKEGTPKPKKRFYGGGPDAMRNWRKQFFESEAKFTMPTSDIGDGDL